MVYNDGDVCRIFRSFCSILLPLTYCQSKLRRTLDVLAKRMTNLIGFEPVAMRRIRQQLVALFERLAAEFAETFAAMG